MSDPPPEEPRTTQRSERPPRRGAGRSLPRIELDRLLAALRPFEDQRLQRQEAIGHGGMGVVEAVRDAMLRRRVALKILDAGLRDDEWGLSGFLREAQVTSQLDHPNIVPVHDLGLTPEGHACFTMKLVEGRTLEALVSERPVDELDSDARFERLEIISRVADALAFAHARGVVHGDVKPQNVMVGDHGQVYLMDWGLARCIETRALAAERGRRVVVEALEDKGDFGVCGTPAFMAPEQAAGRGIDERTDVFAVGALLYHAFSGRPPYEGEHVTSVVELAEQHALLPLTEVAPAGQVPPGLDRIVMTAMARDPAERQQTMRALRESIRDLVRGGWSSRNRNVQAGEVVIREGDLGGEAFAIVRGRFEARRRVDGQDLKLREMGPGEVFGEMAILMSAPRTASVVALEDGQLVALGRDALERELSGMTPWMAVILRTLARRLKSVEDARLGEAGASSPT